MAELYTTQLGAGLGMVEETRVLLDLWTPDMDGAALLETALSSGRFPNMTARRLRNMVVECFAPRYLVNNARPAKWLKGLKLALAGRELEQLLFIFTCRANLILADFVRDVYWPAYAGGRAELSNDLSMQFVVDANREGKTTKPWSDNMIQRVAGYLTGCCADFGMLERGRRRVRRIVPVRLEPRVAAVLAYDLHFAGCGDNSLLNHPDWALFGLERADVLNELKSLALKRLLIVQSAGDLTQISWQCDTQEALINVITQGQF